MTPSPFSSCGSRGKKISCEHAKKNIKISTQEKAQLLCAPP